MGFSTSAAGITMTDDIMNLSEGWFVVYRDGSVITENMAHWDKVRKKEIRILGIKWHDRIWKIDGDHLRDTNGNVAFIQFKHGSAPLVSGDIPVTCEERCIGYYDKDGNKVVYRINNWTGQMRMEVQELDGRRSNEDSE